MATQILLLATVLSLGSEILGAGNKIQLKPPAQQYTLLERSHWVRRG